MNLIQKLVFATFAIAVSLTVFNSASTAYATQCAGTPTSIIGCSGDGKSKKVEDNGAWQLLLIVLNIMTGGVAIAAIGGFVYAGILYATAEDKADRVAKAKQTMFNVVLGLIAFAFMFSFLQFLIPGGIF